MCFRCVLLILVFFAQEALSIEHSTRTYLTYSQNNSTESDPVITAVRDDHKVGVSAGYLGMTKISSKWKIRFGADLTLRVYNQTIQPYQAVTITPALPAPKSSGSFSNEVRLFIERKTLYLDLPIGVQYEMGSRFSFFSQLIFATKIYEKKEKSQANVPAVVALQPEANTKDFFLPLQLGFQYAFDEAEKYLLTLHSEFSIDSPIDEKKQRLDSLNFGLGFIYIH